MISLVSPNGEDDMRIVIVYELPQRELENDLLLKSYFEERGYQCDLVKFPFANPIQLRKKYCNKIDIIFTHSLPNINGLYNLVFEVFGKVPFIFNMQVEQIGTNKTENESHRWPSGIVQNAFHVCWGDKTREILLLNGFEDSHLILGGAIQMDSLRREFDGYYLNKEELYAQYGIDTKRTVCLFISSFSYVGLAENDRIMLKGKIGEQNFDYFEDLSIKSKNGMLAWFRKLLEERPDITVIYRMHPAEKNSDDLIEMANEYSESFKLISDYSVKQWILVSDILMTWYSTAAAEAFFSNKKVLILRPVSIIPEYEVTILNGTNNISTYEQFTQCLNEGSFSSLNEESIRLYYDVNAAVPTFARIGDAACQIAKNKNNAFPWDQVDLKKFMMRNIKRSIQWYIMQVYYFILDFLKQISEKTGITFGKDIQRRIKNKIRSDQKEAAQQKEIARILTNEEKIKEITENFSIRAESI